MAHKPEDQLMVRINVTLPLAVARELRSRVPEKQRSKLIAGLLEKHFEEEEKYDPTRGTNHYRQ